LDADTAKRLNEAVGRFVLTWAEMEGYLDLLILVLWRNPRPPGEIPHALSEKIKFVKKLAPTYAGVAPELDTILIQIANHALKRHDYIHGAAVSHTIDERRLTVTFARLLQPPKKPRRKPVKTTIEEIDQLSDDVYELAGRLLDAAEAVHNFRRNIS
jgi:hypothetical protein